MSSKKDGIVHIGGFPGHALACQLYLEGGIRSVELGSLYLGSEDENGATVTAAPYDLVPLALPAGRTA